MWLLTISILVLSVILFIFRRWYKLNYGYWKDKNVPYIKTSSILGNMQDILLLRNSAAEGLQVLYNNKISQNQPFVGINVCHKPGLVLRDLDIIKNILVKDINYFSNRYSSSDPHSDALGSYNLFFVKNPLWKQIRANITPIFTSGKMKQLFLLVNDIGKHLDSYLNSLPVNPDTNAINKELRDICSSFTIDVVASTAYGIEANCINNPNSEFRKNGKHIFNFTMWRAVEFASFFFIPQLVSVLKCKVFSTESTQFLRSTLNYVLGEREKTKIVRNDLIDLLLSLKKSSKIKINNEDVKFDGDMLVAQAAIFFTAGYETTSSTISFALYELSKNPAAQKCLRQEIRDVLAKNNGELTYDIIHNMTYLNMVILETLRLYPSLPFLDRQCDLPNGETDGYPINSDFVVPDKMPLYIPIYAIHRDEQYFPDPNTFNPERFSPANKENIVPYSFLPFGTGGRACIGERFGIMQTKIGLFYFLKSHYVKMTDKTTKNMKLEPRALIIQAKHGIYCDIVRDPLFN